MNHPRSTLLPRPVPVPRHSRVGGWAGLLLLGALLLTALLLPAPAHARTVDPERLDRGPDVALPHLEGGRVVDGDTTTRRVPGKYRSVLGRTGSSYVVLSRKDGAWRTWRVSADRDARELFRGVGPGEVLLSADGRALAVQRYLRQDRTRVVLRSPRTGDVRASRVFPGYRTLLDVSGRRAILASYEQPGTVLWNAATGRVRLVTSRLGYRADLATNRLAAFTDDPYAGGCTVVTSLNHPRHTLWRSCDERVEAFSTDGRRVATVHKLSDGIGAGRVWERTLRGARLAVYDPPSYVGAIRWESGTDLLLDVHGQDRWAVVRCSEGPCERASGWHPENVW
ncbi:MAG: hypothetical protein CMH83_08985 [Nocardioides sp.]|nr:hypothetical protein [Nocardioides sp.]